MMMTMMKMMMMNRMMGKMLCSTSVKIRPAHADWKINLNALRFLFFTIIAKFQVSDEALGKKLQQQMLNGTHV